MLGKFKSVLTHLFGEYDFHLPLTLKIMLITRSFYLLMKTCFFHLLYISRCPANLPMIDNLDKMKYGFLAVIIYITVISVRSDTACL